MRFRNLDGETFSGKRALVRVDFNVPVRDGEITDETRLRAAVPTIRKLQKAGARIVLLAHFERPKGKHVPEMSLRPVARALGRLLDQHVRFADDCIGLPAQRAVAALAPGDVLLLENVRFHLGEEDNDPAFAAQLAELGDVYVNDAFSAAHRAHASTEALARLLPAYAGESMRRELEMLNRALGQPTRPVLGIVGGSKVSTKLDLLRNLITKLDHLAIGGAMANTFLRAQGHRVGASMHEENLIETAQEIMAAAESAGCGLLLPLDVVVSEQVVEGAAALVRGLDQVQDNERILDAGPRTLDRLVAAMEASKTIVWNGPLGVFEVPPFDKATVEAARHAAALAKSGRVVAVAGGGDTVSALYHAGVAEDFTFVSTAGGAFLEWMEGKELPGVAALARES